MGPVRQAVEEKLLRWGLLGPLLLGLLLVDCGKGKPAASSGLELQPVPAAPALRIAPEALPGANGALAVVAARPHGVAGSDVHPTLTFSRPVMSLGTVEEQAKAPPPAQLQPAVAGARRVGVPGSFYILVLENKN